MKRFTRILLLKPVLWAAKKFSSRPDRKRIFKALSFLYKEILEQKTKKGVLIPFDKSSGKVVIFSDQHKGAGNGADDFVKSEKSYIAALNYYYSYNYFFISLGDSEELWETSLSKIKEHYEAIFRIETAFIQKRSFIKIFGNHDLYWGNDPFAARQLKKTYNDDAVIYEGVILTTSVNNKPFRVFCTHGHQGDAQSDGNLVSKFFVARIWAPLQAYLNINPNTPAYDKEKKTLHNEIMYEWSLQQANTILITGHTHQPVFESLTHIERLYKQLQAAQMEHDNHLIGALKEEIRLKEPRFTAVSVDYMTMKPSYFNSGCCCFSDGDITGIEIENGFIRLIKWGGQKEFPERIVLEEASLEIIARLL